MFRRSLLAKVLSAALLFGGAPLAAGAQTLSPTYLHPYGQPWPTQVWPESDILKEETAVEVDKLIAEIMEGGRANPLGETRAVLVIENGRLVREVYGEGFGPETKQISWSMAKSITHALVGRWMMLGRITNIDAPMPSPWAQDDPRSQITWRQWMNMTDGLDYEEMGQTDISKSDVSKMMFGEGRFDVIDYVRGLKSAHEPGEHWNYSTAAYHTIGWALAQTAMADVSHLLTDEAIVGFETQALTNVQAGVDAGQLPASQLDFTRNFFAKLNELPEDRRWPYFRAENMRAQIQDSLFAQLGMEAQPEFDPSGTYLGGSLIWASARDFAKIGYLYLRNGMWEGRQLLPNFWVDIARTKVGAENTDEYGMGWWITPPEGRGTMGTASDIGPRDSFSAQGHEGQIIWVVPSRDLVIVRLGLMQNGRETWGQLYDWCQRVAMAFPDLHAINNAIEQTLQEEASPPEPDDAP